MKIMRQAEFYGDPIDEVPEEDLYDDEEIAASLLRRPGIGRVGNAPTV